MARNAVRVFDVDEALPVTVWAVVFVVGRSTGAEESVRQEATERVHVVHEGDASEGDRRVYIEGVGCNQPDFRAKGEQGLRMLSSGHVLHAKVAGARCLRRAARSCSFSRMQFVGQRRKILLSSVKIGKSCYIRFPGYSNNQIFG